MSHEGAPEFLAMPDTIAEQDIDPIPDPS
jgi:hypothetical protein